ncbi:TPA: hypothetical protein ACIPCN_004571, partial [Salmonella enterica subsp. enterica serovar Mgulani]
TRSWHRIRQADSERLSASISHLLEESKFITNCFSCILLIIELTFTLAEGNFATRFLTHSDNIQIYCAVQTL